MKVFAFVFPLELKFCNKNYLILKSSFANCKLETFFKTVDLILSNEFKIRKFYLSSIHNVVVSTLSQLFLAASNFSRATWDKRSNSCSPSALTIPQKMPFWFCNNVCGSSNSLALPESITRTRSESMIVCNRWATVKTVHSVNFCRIVCWISKSVLRKEVQPFLN